MPAAIEGEVASRKRILCVTRNGSTMMNLQELQIITQNMLPVTVILFSNKGYEAIR